MTRESLFPVFFFAGLLFLLYQLALFLAPFSSPLILAVIVALSLAPVNARLTRALGGSRSGSAILLTLGSTLIIVVPMLALLGVLAQEASGAYDRLAQSLQETGTSPLVASEHWLHEARSWLTQRFSLLGSLDFTNLAKEASKNVAGWLAAEANALVANLATGLLDFSMLLVALFFFFRDGDRIVETLRDLIPMESADKERVAVRFADTVTAVVQSTAVIAVLQGIVAGVGYALIGRLSVSVLLGFLTGIASLVPMVGSALIWLPTSIYLMATGGIWSGVLLMLWGALAVGSVDNFVRPLVIGKSVEMPTLLLIFALLGGLQVYGFLGIFLAPVVLAVLMTFLDIYRERYAGVEAPGLA